MASREQFNELLRLITRQVLKEYSSIVPDDDNSDSNTSTTNTKPPDAMSSLEKAKADREAKKKQQDQIDQIRTATMDLSSTKKQSSYFKQQLKKNELDIQAKTKQLQQMKGGPKAVVPAGGTVVENS